VRIPLTVSSVPQDDFSKRVTWQAATPQSVREFSAIAYLFGRHLNEHLDVPIGIIQATVGGTAAEAWMSAEALQGFPEFATKIASLKQTSDQSRANYQEFLLRSAHWYQKHGNEDRGQIDEQPGRVSIDADLSLHS
jgi:sialate O-acetylesterase